MLRELCLCIIVLSLNMTGAAHRPYGNWRPAFTGFRQKMKTSLDIKNVEVTMKNRPTRTMQFMASHRPLNDNPDANCCHGTLGYAWGQPRMPCSAMKCCNQSEIVAVIPVDYALGFCFRCMPKDKLLPVCYGAGLEVGSTNRSPDYKPRACCDDAKFAVIVNKWFAGMTIRCVAR